MKIYYHTMTSPVDELLLVGDEAGLTGIYFVEHKGGPSIGADWQKAPGHPVIKEAVAALREYFAGKRNSFDLHLSPNGTTLQKQVWNELRRIPFGETITYAELARRVGRPSAVRAVASAVGRNPLSVIVPCHRVIGSSGKLTGFAGGLERKKYLLDLEQRGRVNR